MTGVRRRSRLRRVRTLDTATNTPIGDPIKVGDTPIGIRLSLDGRRAYVANLEDASVSVIDTTNNSIVGQPIPVRNGPTQLALSPDGRTLYVLNDWSGALSIINTANNTVIGQPIPVGGPQGAAGFGGCVAAPDGKRLYVVEDEQLWSIDTTTNVTVGDPINVPGAFRVTISPDGHQIYVGRRGGVTAFPARSLP